MKKEKEKKTKHEPNANEVTRKKNEVKLKKTNSLQELLLFSCSLMFDELKVNVSDPP